MVISTSRAVDNAWENMIDNDIDAEDMDLRCMMIESIETMLLLSYFLLPAFVDRRRKVIKLCGKDERSSAKFKFVKKIGVYFFGFSRIL